MYSGQRFAILQSFLHFCDGKIWLHSEMILVHWKLRTLCAWGLNNLLPQAVWWFGKLCQRDRHLPRLLQQSLFPLVCLTLSIFDTWGLWLYSCRCQEKCPSNISPYLGSLPRLIPSQIFFHHCLEITDEKKSIL